jgi:hypothetical protein
LAAELRSFPRLTVRLKYARDARGIGPDCREFNSADVAEKLRLIEDQCTRSIVVTHGDSEARLRRLNGFGPAREVLRGLQPFIMHIYPDGLRSLMRPGRSMRYSRASSGFLGPFHHLYDEDFGLNLKGGLAGCNELGY